MDMEAAAVARLAERCGEALLAFSAEVRASSAMVQEALPVETVEVPEGRGVRQKEILAVSGLGEEQGLKTAEVASAIDYEVPNTYSTLQALQRAALVEMIPNSTPQRWRLAARYRTSSAVFARMAYRLREGEWTTYGDISIAVRGDQNAARGVGQAAVAPGFPFPERVLMAEGRINPNWKDSHGRGPEECRRRLEEQGIRFIDDERADPAQKVAWDELLRRDKEEPVDE